MDYMDRKRVLHGPERKITWTEKCDYMGGKIKLINNRRCKGYNRESKKRLSVNGVINEKELVFSCKQ